MDSYKEVKVKEIVNGLEIEIPRNSHAADYQFGLRQRFTKIVVARLRLLVKKKMRFKLS